MLRGRPFNSWGWEWVISGHQEFFFLAIWWAGYFFPFFSHKLSITFVLHEIFFFRQALAGNLFSKSPTPPPLKSLMVGPLVRLSLRLALSCNFCLLLTYFIYALVFRRWSSLHENCAVSIYYHHHHYFYYYLLFFTQSSSNSNLWTESWW